MRGTWDTRIFKYRIHIRHLKKMLFINTNLLCMRAWLYMCECLCVLVIFSSSGRSKIQEAHAL